MATVSDAATTAGGAATAAVPPARPQQKASRRRTTVLAFGFLLPALVVLGAQQGVGTCIAGGLTHVLIGPGGGVTLARSAAVRLRPIQREVELQYVDPRLAEYAELAPAGVFVHQRLHL